MPQPLHRQRSSGPLILWSCLIGAACLVGCERRDDRATSTADPMSASQPIGSASEPYAYPANPDAAASTMPGASGV